MKDFIEQFSPKDNNKPLIYRTRYETCPILYANQTEPEFYGVRTIYDKWNEDTKVWEFWHKKEQLFRINTI
jgi:hypothetical protein